MERIHKLKNIPYNPRKRFNIPVVKEDLKSLCFLKGQKAKTSNSNEKQFIGQDTPELSDYPYGDTCTVNIKERALSLSDWQASGGDQPRGESEAVDP